MQILGILICYCLLHNSNAEVFSTPITAYSYDWSTKSFQALPKVTKGKLVKVEEIDDNDDDYNDDNDETESGRHSQNRNTSLVTLRIGKSYTWGKWDKWSKCAKSCVQIRRRPCVERIQNDTLSEPLEIVFYPDIAQNRTGCRGIMKKYRLCKDEKCKSNTYLRDEQCEDFNRIPHKGKFYNWQGYEKEHDECELFCRPINSEVFVSRNQSVTDGTPCEKPSVYYTHYYRMRAVCVEGICKAVHSNGAIRPATTNDSNRKCGSVLCQIVSEIFSKPHLNHGNNYVTNIPAGAMNVTIKQMAKSENILALKTTDDVYIINGHNRASESGIFEYNENVFDYNRELGIITSRGPLSKPVVLMLFVRGLNTGIKYDYTMPVPSASINEDEELKTSWNELGQPLDDIEDNNIESETGQVARGRVQKRRKFAWKLLRFGECNRSCGPGIQPPIFRCIREISTRDAPTPTRFFSPKRCAFAEKPVFSEDIYQCNRGLCPAYWRSGDFGDCQCALDDVTSSSTGVNTTLGVRTRLVQCVQEQITGLVQPVSVTQCAQLKPTPVNSENCVCPKQMLRRKIYARVPPAANTAKVYARLIGQSAPSTVRNIRSNSTAPPSAAPPRRQNRDERVDKVGVWLMSEWTQQCSKECGAGFEHRSIYCDRTMPFTDLCDLRYTPEQRRACSAASSQRAACQRGVWFAAEWSNCSGDCFRLQRTRAVLCVADGVVVDDGECAAVQRPAAVKNCSHKEVDYCGPRWHYSEWSECSRPCGEGIQRRYAKCLDYDWKQNSLVESNNCKYLDREPVYGVCNAQKCEAVEDTVNTLQNDVATPPVNCSDEVNCKRINRQRLCKLPYYQTYCCLTCNGYY